MIAMSSTRATIDRCPRNKWLVRLLRSDIFLIVISGLSRASPVVNRTWILRIVPYLCQSYRPGTGTSGEQHRIPTFINLFYRIHSRKEYGERMIPSLSRPIAAPTFFFSMITENGRRPFYIFNLLSSSSISLSISCRSSTSSFFSANRFFKASSCCCNRWSSHEEAISCLYPEYDLLSHTTHVRAFHGLDIYTEPWAGAIGQYRKGKQKTEVFVNSFTCKTSLSIRYATSQNPSIFVPGGEREKSSWQNSCRWYNMR